ncbi:MAG: signal recognition particle-docking protein FtsY [Spirochaetales bacterium]|nr:signal recognition particle-docking protein FtsY [Spirochaetales bacterium]
MFFGKKKDLGTRIKRLFGLGPHNEAYYEELEELFLESDLGPRVTLELLEELRELGKKDRLGKEEDLKVAVQQLLSGSVKTAQLTPQPGALSCFLILGVNGVGKTTTIAKLATYYRRQKITDKIVLAAGDTFRAAATDQLITHGQRQGFRVVSQGPGADPGAVLFDAIESAKSRGEDLVIADTAGRLHNKANLVKELQKIDRIGSSKVGPERYKKILVLDATTGQNGLQQAQVFHEALGLDGIILSKYDSTARGGMVVSVSRSLELPFFFVGTGESMEDFAPFSAETFIQDLVNRIL